jgi:hypothetical protein
MRVFICPYNGFSLAIPTEFIASIFIQPVNLSKSIHYNKNHISYISLPILLNCKNLNIRHGIILKNINKDITKDKIILLSAKIESEQDIPDKDFYPLPKIMDITKFSHIFNGIFFNARHTDTSINESAAEIILLLNPEQLVKNILKEINL